MPLSVCGDNMKELPADDQIDSLVASIVELVDKYIDLRKSNEKHFCIPFSYRNQLCRAGRSCDDCKRDYYNIVRTEMLKEFLGDSYGRYEESLSGL